jgi:large subunit ribosomal protein L30
VSRLVVKQVRSLIGRPGDQRATVRALGLKRIGHTVEHDDTPSVRGMLSKVKHLVKVSDVQ